MKTTAFIWAVAPSLVLPTEALVFDRRQDSSSPRVLNLGITRGSLAPSSKPNRVRRRGAATATLDNLETLYFVNATLGTPPQPVRLHLDTGSSDLWVNTPGSALCASTGRPCSISGTYAANSSSSYAYVGSYFNISYVDGSGASGDYATDTLAIAGVSLPSLQFGIGYQSTSPQGILGIGYPVNEVQVGRAKLKPYDNLSAKMAADGMIASNAYSLYLNDLDASTGNILFGGVDTDRFEGELATLPIQAEGGIFAEFFITLTQVKFGTSVVGDRMALAVLLDSGSSLTYLPDDMADTMFQMAGAVFQPDQGVALIPCSMAGVNANLTLTFSGVSIAVPMNELVLDLLPITGKRLSFSNGQQACLFGVAPAGTGTNVLGDTFLRSAYVVYDLGNNQISLAQTKFNTTTSNVVEIGSGKGAVPSATLVANAVAATSGIARGASAAASVGAPGAGMTVLIAVAFAGFGALLL